MTVNIVDTITDDIERTVNVVDTTVIGKLIWVDTITEE